MAKASFPSPDFSDILSKLDFNSVHSGDPVARVYYGEAAAAIRVLERETEYWRRRFTVEAGRRLDAGRAADALADILSRIITGAEIEAELERLSTPSPMPKAEIENPVSTDQQGEVTC